MQVINNFRLSTLNCKPGQNVNTSVNRDYKYSQNAINNNNHSDQFISFKALNSINPEAQLRLSMDKISKIADIAVIKCETLGLSDVIKDITEKIGNDNCFKVVTVMKEYAAKKGDRSLKGLLNLHIAKSPDLLSKYENLKQLALDIESKKHLEIALNTIAKSIKSDEINNFKKQLLDLKIQQFIQPEGYEAVLLKINN
jgi:hypothetical protein